MDSPPVSRPSTYGQAPRAREYDVLAFICRRIAESGQAPNVREVMAHIDSPSTSVARYFITKLVTRGLLTRSPRIPRGIEVTDLARERHPELFPRKAPEIVLDAVLESRAANELLPARVMDALCVVNL